MSAQSSAQVIPSSGASWAVTYLMLPLQAQREKRGCHSRIRNSSPCTHRQLYVGRPQGPLRCDLLPRPGVSGPLWSTGRSPEWGMRSPQGRAPPGTADDGAPAPHPPGSSSEPVSAAYCRVTNVHKLRVMQYKLLITQFSRSDIVYCPTGLTSECGPQGDPFRCLSQLPGAAVFLSWWPSSTFEASEKVRPASNTPPNLFCLPLWPPEALPNTWNNLF